MFLVIVSLYLAVSVAMGALGAHFLEPRLSEAAISAFHTAIDYHQLYALFCFIMLILTKKKGEFAKVFSRLMPLGLIKLFFLALSLFSGSIYVYVFTGNKMWIKLTPVGGFLLIFAWTLTAFLALRYSLHKVKYRRNNDDALPGDD